MSRYILLSFIFMSFSFSDSPITSTIFYDNYLDIKIINDGNKTGILTERGCFYLSSDTISMENKLALINALSWKIPEYDKSPLINFSNFLNFLSKKYNHQFYLDKPIPYKNHELLCLAYLRAMDDYFNMEVPTTIINRIEGEIEMTLSFNIIKSLIYSQKLLDNTSDWCKIWENYYEVFSNNNLIVDIKIESINDISSYIDGYKEYCN